MRPAWAIQFFIFSMLLSASHSARAAYLGLVGVANSSEPNEPGTTYGGKPAFGAGVLLEFRLNGRYKGFYGGHPPMLGLEFGAFSITRKFSDSQEVPVSAQHTWSAKMLEFPVLLRGHLGRFSLGAGAYYAIASGDMVQETATPGRLTSSQTYPLATFNHAKTDYGLVASLALYFGLAPFTSLLFDARYTMGLKNQALHSGERRYNDQQLLAGLRFGF